MNDDMSDIGSSMMVIRHKVVMVGDICVGKTSIICRFTENKFNDSYDVTILFNQPTIGLDFFVKDVNFKGASIKFQIWDSAGQERYKSLIPSYVKGASIIFIIFDLSSNYYILYYI